MEFAGTEVDRLGTSFGVLDAARHNLAVELHRNRRAFVLQQDDHVRRERVETLKILVKPRSHGGL